MTNNNVQQQQNLVTVLVGRNNKAVVYELNTSVSRPSEFSTQGYSYALPEGRYTQKMFELAAKVIHEARGKGANLELYTAPNLAIKAREYFAFKKNGRQDFENLVKQGMIPVEGDSEEIIALKEATREACMNYLEAIEMMVNSGLKLSIRNTMDFNRIELIVPEGVELVSGQALNFFNGKSKKGVTVRNWTNFKRTNAIVNYDSRRQVYFLWRNISTLKDKYVMAMIKRAWEACPAAEFELKINEHELQIA